MAELIYKDAFKQNCKITGKFMDNFYCVSLATLGEVIDNQPTTTETEIRAKAIDDFSEKMKWEYENSTGIPKREIEFAKAVINQVAKRLKEA